MALITKIRLCKDFDELIKRDFGSLLLQKSYGRMDQLEGFVRFPYGDMTFPSRSFHTGGSIYKAGIVYPVCLRKEVTSNGDKEPYVLLHSLGEIDSILPRFDWISKETFDEYKLGLADTLTIMSKDEEDL